MRDLAQRNLRYEQEQGDPSGQQLSAEHPAPKKAMELIKTRLDADNRHEGGESRQAAIIEHDQRQDEHDGGGYGQRS